MRYPKMYLAIDNVSASKRWTLPNEWFRLIKNAGVSYIEVSADNECDPLYSTLSYLIDWIKEVKHCCEKNGMFIANLFSGHGTYATTGLSHNDKRIRHHILENWIKPYIRMAGELNAGVGFFCHAFPSSILQSKDKYMDEVRKLEEVIRQVRDYALLMCEKPISVEQMYSPHQYPWTIKSAKDFISNTGVYITLDTGHQVGQKMYLRPSRDEIERACFIQEREIWVGTINSQRLLREARCGKIGAKEAVKYIEEDMDNNPQLFSDEKDGDLYHWVKELGCYSPIIHLQQTDGSVSNHWSFIDEYNKKGIVDPAKLLKSLYQSYMQEKKAGMPEPCKKITLTLELFFSNSDYLFEICSQLTQSVKYWRKYVPEDGMYLNELPCIINSEENK